MALKIVLLFILQVLLIKGQGDIVCPPRDCPSTCPSIQCSDDQIARPPPCGCCNECEDTIPVGDSCCTSRFIGVPHKECHPGSYCKHVCEDSNDCNCYICTENE